MSSGTTPTTVSTHILDTTIGRPAQGVTVELAVREKREKGDGQWEPAGTSTTDADGRCKDFPPLPPGTTQARLLFAVEPYLSLSREPSHEPSGEPSGEPSHEQARGMAFFPEVAIAFAVTPGEHYHVPLLLNPFGYSVYRGS
ncbi:hydroxyisourate hydrolase [Streptomyces sp. NPDC051162]|uniref:hydroxyisourate hydrolase n=1 Tax=Streptomyces sp. NPDC051162 TaxID=3154747 RepID=UPI003416D8FA